jgi:hypothetical protein
VSRFAIGKDFIIVEFKSGEVYLYNHAAPGKRDVAAMIERARSGRLLATYINQHVRSNYAARLPNGQRS